MQHKPLTADAVAPAAPRALRASPTSGASRAPPPRTSSAAATCRRAPSRSRSTRPEVAAESGRRWDDSPGRSLLVSLLLRPPPGAAAEQLSLVAGLCVAEAVEEQRRRGAASSGRTTSCSPGARWPACCSRPPRAPSSAGSGQRLADRGRATGADAPAGGLAADRARVARSTARRCSASLLEILEHRYDAWRRSGLAPLLDELEARNVLRGSGSVSPARPEAGASPTGGIAPDGPAHAPPRGRWSTVVGSGEVESRPRSDDGRPSAPRPLSVHVREAEATLDAEVAERDVVVGRARHLDDPVVLHVELERAADAAVRADRLGHHLLVLTPLPRRREARAPSGT